VYKIIKSILFAFSPEQAHRLTLGLIGLVLYIPGVSWLFKLLFRKDNPTLERELFGLHFKNPVGLAAGFDKDGKYLSRMQHLGFGFIEIGTVTPKPQDGNPKPRLFRIKADHALINRMGFNNEGVDALVNRLKHKKLKYPVIIGGNIGKNKITPNEQAEEDYLKCFEALFDYVDYFVVNVSSPNTPDLRDLQEKEPLKKLLSLLQNKNNSYTQPKPILLKIAPDLSNGQLDDIIEIVRETKLAGIIATNTTISRSGLISSGSAIKKIGNGGLSGRPLVDRSTEVIRYIAEKSNNQITIIGVGGIHDPQDAIDKLNAGASLIQIYTGLIYEGPGLVKKINRALLKK
jgi:dihydroorotate dehydrogenase